MLLSTKKVVLDSTVSGYGVSLGTIEDIVFHGHTWRVRFLKLKTPGLLGGSRLLSPHAVKAANWLERQVRVDLHESDVDNLLEPHLVPPISQRMKRQRATLPPPSFWTPLTYGMMPVIPYDEPELETEDETLRRVEDLRSCREVTGYALHTSDGSHGKISDILFDDDVFSLPFVVVSLGSWPDKRLSVISSQRITSVNWSERACQVDMSSQDVEAAPDFAPGTPVNRQIEEVRFDIYGRVCARSAIGGDDGRPDSRGVNRPQDHGNGDHEPMRSRDESRGETSCSN